MKKKHNVKTNAMRFLDTHKADYKVYEYESDGFSDGLTVAKKLGQDPEQVFKTLVAVGKSKEHYVFVIPVAEELDLKKAAAAVGEKSVEMIHVKDINAVTGYIRGGCSPIGMKKHFRTIIHLSAENQNTIIFSGGKIGLQIEMDPKVLASLIGSEFKDITFGRS